jgi:hypothetical protein
MLLGKLSNLAIEDMKMYPKTKNLSTPILSFLLLGLTILSLAFLIACYTTASETIKASLTSLFINIALASLIICKVKRIEKQFKLFFFALMIVNVILIIYSSFLLFRMAL